MVQDAAFILNINSRSKHLLAERDLFTVGTRLRPPGCSWRGMKNPDVTSFSCSPEVTVGALSG